MTAGQMLDNLEDALVGRRRKTPDGKSWLQPVMHRSTLGLSVLLVLLVGIAEVAWLLEGSGLTLVMKAIHRVFGH